MLPRIFGAYEPLRRDYPIDEFMREAVPAGVVKSVFVQVNVAPGKEVDEVAWVQSVADRNPLPTAITAFADLSAADVGDVLDRELAVGSTRAIRQQLHWHEKPLYRFAERPDIMNDPSWRRGLREVERRGLMFELQVFAGQMRDAVGLARDFPGLTFVLLHAGMLEDRSEAGWARWRAGMTAARRMPERDGEDLGPRNLRARVLGGELATGRRRDGGPLRTVPVPLRQQLPDREAVDDL